MTIEQQKHATSKAKKKTFKNVEGKVNMKRNMELIRSILLILEELDDNEFKGLMEIEGYEKKEIDYHLQQMLNSNLLKGYLSNADDEVNFHSVAITWEGHQFLDASRNDNVWFTFKKELGIEAQSIPISVTVDVLKQLSKEYFKNKFGL